MFDDIVCAARDHDPRLVGLAAALCFFAASTAIRLLGRARASHGHKRVWWLTLVGFAAGSAIWATHFIAMLAYNPPARVTFGVGATFLSLLVAILMTGVGFGVALSSGRLARALAGGAIVGLGIAAMHYLGMNSLHFDGHVAWDNGLVVASLIFGVAFSCVSLAMARVESAWRTQVGASVSLTLAILLLHFTAMVASHLTPVVAVTSPSLSFSTAGLSLSIAGVIVAILGVSLTGAAFDQRLDTQIEKFDDELRRQENSFLMMFRNNPVPMWVFDRETLLFLAVNPATVEHYGYSERELIGTSVLNVRPPEDREAVLASIASEINGYATGRTWRHIRADGAIIEVAVYKTFFKFEGRDAVLIASVDINVKSGAEEMLAHLAEHDALTGLANRAAFLKHLDATLARCRGEKSMFAIFSIDLDRFQSVNDLYGNAIGDVLLRALSKRMEQAVAGHFIARLGGDEFAALITIDNDPAMLADLCDGLHTCARNGLEIGDERVHLEMAIGVAVYPRDAETATELLGNANAALYRAKVAGRGVTHIYEPEVDLPSRERATLLRDLRLAVERREFVLFYQPQFRVGGELIGFEALIRWRHPQRGLVSPGVFIPIAEESGLIIPIAEWTIMEACREASTWPPQLSVAVNLSPLQFRHHDVVNVVQTTLFNTGLSPRRLELEITEGIMIEDHNRTLSILRRLKAIGIRIAMDDFGTGYSSLSYLQSFPFDKIKIDQTFVAHLGETGHSNAIVRAIIGLGHGLGLPVLAEGVETNEQLSILARKGCDEIQGYLMGRPMPIQAHAELIRCSLGERRDIAV